MAMVSLNKRNGISMLDCETYKSIRYNPFYLPLHKSGLSRLKLTLPSPQSSKGMEEGVIRYKGYR